MRERKERLVLFLITITISATLLYSGHGAKHDTHPVAFLRYSSEQAIIRLKGDIPSPGIYRFPEHSRLLSVIKLTAPSLVLKSDIDALAGREIINGEVVRLTAKDREIIAIEISRMGAREKILLGIPLLPDEMDRADWESLPGIGPELADAIMEYRQKNGVIGRLDSLLKVRGIGEKKLEAIRGYFATQ